MTRFTPRKALKLTRNAGQERGAVIAVEPGHGETRAGQHFGFIVSGFGSRVQIFGFSVSGLLFK